MRVVFLTQYFPPEVGAAQNRLSSLAQYLRQAGHSVTVLTALPNYPGGEIFKGYQGNLIIEERIEGIKVIRTWIYASKKKDFLHRLVNYSSFALSSLLFGIWKAGRPDVVVVESPPLFLGISGFVISLLKRARLVLNISDLWPASAVALGMVQNKVLLALSERLEQFLYRMADLITGQTQGIVERIRSRCPGRAVDLIPNGADVSVLLLDVDKRRHSKEGFGLDGRFVVGYAGLFGLANGLEVIIQAAQILSGYGDVLFALFGDGPRKEELVRLASHVRLSNVRFYPTLPRFRMPEVLASFDVALVPLKRRELFKGALPSKMFEAMAAAIPLVLAIEGEAQVLVEQGQAGICVEPENPQAIADAVLKLYHDPSYRKSLGENGRRYVTEHYDRRQIAKEFERLLLELNSSK
jgi:glycosyltransferase involved in cell wall biosynthesis